MDRMEMPKKKFRVIVDGKPHEVEIEEGGLGEPLSVTVDGESYRVEVEEAEVGPTRVEEAVVKPLTRPAPAVEPALEKPPEMTVEEGVVRAPIPGKILSVKVEVGGSVEVGDVLLVLEAMKMENEIKAPKAGVVREIAVSEGVNVNYGDTLLIIE
ncbi:MAG: biotin/lipoyl-containing protein [Candidatus Geothermarchaeales archaeon]